MKFLLAFLKEQSTVYSTMNFKTTVFSGGTESHQVGEDLDGDDNDTLSEFLPHFMGFQKC